MSIRNLSERDSPLAIVPSPLGYASKPADTPVVFCDFDGPVVDVSERYYQTYRKGLLATEEQHQTQAGHIFSLRPLPKAQFWQMKQDRRPDREIAACSGMPEELFGTFMQQVERIVNHPSLLRWDRLQPTANSALAYFRSSKVRLVLVTLRHPRQVQDFLRSQNLEGFVDQIYGIPDIKAAHANRVAQKCELLGEAIAQQQALGYLTHRSWMIGDTEADILAGQSHGLATAALSCGIRSEAYLGQLNPSSMFDSLLTAAKAVVRPYILKAA